jgi:CHAT domain-containing protein
LTVKKTVAFLSAILILFLCIQPVTGHSQNNIEQAEKIFQNWFEVVEHASQNYDSSSYASVYDQISEEFFKLYKSSGNSIYLNYSINEAGSIQRERIKSRLSTNELKEVKSTLDKIEKRELPDDYFQLSEFKPENFYTFIRISLNDSLETKAFQLLQHWRTDLSDVYDKSKIMGSALAQALVHGYDKVNEFQEVFYVGEYLVDNNPFPASLFAINLFEIISYASRALGYYNESLYISSNILQPIAEQLGDKNLLYSIKMDYAITLLRIGNTDTALEEYQEVYENLEYLTSSRYRSALFNNLAISYLNTGQFEKYVEFQLEAFELASKEENFGQQLSILRNLFIYYRRQNETELAFNYLNQALELSQEKDLSEETASILLSLGVYRRDVENNPQVALDHFEEALTLSDSTDNYHRYFNSLIEIGETYFALGDEDKAVNNLHQAMDISRERDDSAGYTQAAMRLANQLSLAGYFERAREVANTQQPDDFKQLQFNYEVLANNALIRILMNEEQYSDAEEISDAMINEIITWLRESIDHQTGHMRMDDEFSEAFRLHTVLMQKTNQTEKALIAIGKLRNISRSGFYNNPLLKSQILTDEQLVEDYNIRNRIRNLRRQYADASEEQRVYLGNELLDAISERNALQDSVFPEYQQSTYEDDLRQFQRNLKRDQMAIYVSVFEEHVFRFVITRSDIKLTAFPKEREILDLLTSAVNSFDEGSTNLEDLYQIYSNFFSDVISDQYSHIYFIPDGEFYRLPIGILPSQPVNSSQSYGSSRYLIENFSISYLNTISDLNRERRDRSDFKYDLAGFGVRDFDSAGHPSLQNLPYSVREVQQGAKNLDKFNSKRYFLNNQSTESNFRSIAGDAKILHLATHSKVNDESPLFSAIYFYQNKDDIQPDNGVIYAYELFDMNMDADMVFLSSCESGTGGYLKGAGVLGFSRAFAYAGAKSLSLNLWPVRDQAAASITSEFYKALNSGQNKAEAMRTARLHYLNNSNSDPYLWGAMVIYGNIDAPLEKDGNPVIVFISGSLFTMLLLSFFVLAGYDRSLRSWII